MMTRDPALGGSLSRSEHSRDSEARHVGGGRQTDRCLDAALRNLKGVPGKSGPLVRAGLRSPLVCKGNAALNASAAWQPGARIGAMSSSEAGWRRSTTRCEHGSGSSC